MKSSMNFSGKVIKLLPDDFPYRGGEGAEDMTYNAIKELTEMGELGITPNIKKITGLGKSATQHHLNEMTERGRILKKTAKVRLERTTVICGVYSIPVEPKKKKKKNT